MSRRCVRLVMPSEKQGALRERCPEPARFAIASKTGLSEREYLLWLCKAHRGDEQLIASAFCEEMAGPRP